MRYSSTGTNTDSEKPMRGSATSAAIGGGRIQNATALANVPATLRSMSLCAETRVPKTRERDATRRKRGPIEEDREAREPVGQRAVGRQASEAPLPRAELDADVDEHERRGHHRHASGAARGDRRVLALRRAARSPRARYVAIAKATNATAATA